MIHFKFYICILLYLSAFSGCMPYHFTQRPGVSGKVFDADTNSPIIDVKVQLGRDLPDERYFSIEDKSIYITKSSIDGNFYIAPKKKWGIYVVPMDIFPLPYKLTFTHENFNAHSIEFSYAAWDKPDTVDFGTIYLKQKK